MLCTGAEPVQGFRLQNRLGTGAFGEVWEARAPDGTCVALKFIDSRKKNSALLRSEIRVLQAMRNVGHPNLIRLLGVYASSHYFVLCMEKADGNLDELTQTYLQVTGRYIAPDHLLELMAQAACGLDYIARLKLPGFNLSSTGLQHCDVKPSNLLLLGDMIKIADFGLCAALGEQTHKTGWRGTIPFAAPELYHGRTSSTTDQFALAVTYCKLVAGDRMFIASANSCTATPAIPVDLNKVRENERSVLARALSPDPTRRWPSCQAFVDELRQVALQSRSDKVTNHRLSSPLLISRSDSSV